MLCALAKFSFLILLLGIFQGTSVFPAETLRMFIWEGYAPQEWVDRFEKTILERYGTPVKLSIEHASNPNDFFVKLRSREADIISPGHNLINDERFRLLENRLLLPIDLAVVTHFSDLPAEFQQIEFGTYAGKTFVVPFAQGPYGLAYNSDKVPSPDSWNVLWDASNSKQYTLSEDYYEANIYITALLMGYRGSDIYRFEKLDHNAFRKNLRYLAQNARDLWKGVDKADDLLGLSYGIVWGFSFAQLQQRGETWKFANPREGTFGWIDSFAVSATLQNNPFLKAVANEWLNFVISPEFQAEVVVRQLNSEPVNPLTNGELTKEEINKFNLNHPASSLRNRHLWPTINSRRDRNGMIRLWNQAIAP